MTPSLNRRQILAGMTATTALGACAVPANSPPSQIKFGVASNAWTPSLDTCIAELGKMGFGGIEPFASNVTEYRSDPSKLKAKLDAAGLKLISCSSIGTVMSSDFLDPTKAQQTIEDHVAFSRDFLRHFGCRHFKITIGPRRGDALMTSKQLKQMAGTMNEIGRRTSEFGIRLAPHPSVGSPMERESEVRTVMDMTDSRYVGLVTDTGHLTLGGIDPAKLISDYFPRIAEVHFKDVDRKYKGWTGPTYRDPRPYRVPGSATSGAVDYVGIYAILKNRGYSGFCSLDIDGFDIDGETLDLVRPNAHYIAKALGAPLKV